ncbi:MAG: MFS transporter [Fimbriimonadales bacterium]|nr:MFS transporter [Fimbriimonadales bacterium]
MRAFRHRDFLLLWLGALISFIGSWIQNVGHGWIVFELTRDEAKLAFIAFCSSVPVSLVGPFAGLLADAYDKRWVLIACQAVFAAGALFLAAAVGFGFAQYWHFVLVALLLGLVSTVEMPTRQTVVSRVVPPEELAAAVPLQAMTFNLARIIGPALGGALLAFFGAQACFIVNGTSYAALIFSVLLIRSDLRSVPRVVEPVRERLLAGFRYAWSHRSIRTLLSLEAVVSVFALHYLALMPAIASKMLGLDKQGLGLAMSAVGVGAIAGLLALTSIANRPWRALTIRIAMTSVGLSLLLLSYARTGWQAFPLLMLAGLGTVSQFNTTNALCQLLSPDELRGRVLSLHIWALSGLGPVGLLLFGWIARWLPPHLAPDLAPMALAAQAVPMAPDLVRLGPGLLVSHTGLPLALRIGAMVVLAGALWAWMDRRGLSGLDRRGSARIG